MHDHSPTPWFDTEVDGLPQRVGVYEGSAIGKPGGGGGTVQHGYYYWNGEKWQGWGQSPDDIRPSFPFQARYWRGVIPGQDYPYDQVKTYQPSHFTGTLDTVGTAMGCVVVHRLEIAENQLTIQFTREFISRDPEKYQCTLLKQGTEFIGKAKARIRNFTFNADTHFRAVLSTEVNNNDSFFMALSLKMPTMQWHQFQGVLRRPSTP